MGDWTNQDVVNLALAGNELAMGWYALATGKTLPSSATNTISLNTQTGQLAVGTGPLLLLGLIVVAVVFIAK